MFLTHCLFSQPPCHRCFQIGISSTEDCCASRPALPTMEQLILGRHRQDQLGHTTPVTGEDTLTKFTHYHSLSVPLRL